MVRLLFDTGLAAYTDGVGQLGKWSQSNGWSTSKLGIWRQSIK